MDTPDLATQQKQYATLQEQYEDAVNASRAARDEIHKLDDEAGRLNNLVRATQPLNTYVVHFMVNSEAKSTQVQGHYIQHTLRDNYGSLTVHRYMPDGCAETVATFYNVISCANKDAVT